MGNVNALSAPPSPPSPAPPPPLSPTSTQGTTPSKIDGCNGLENPGPLEELHRKCKGTAFHFNITYKNHNSLVLTLHL